MTTPMTGHPDRAMGLELEANDLESRLEGAEADGDEQTADGLRRAQAAVLRELATTDPWPATGPLHIHAPRARDAA